MSETLVTTVERNTTTGEPVVTRIISDAGFDSLKPVWDSLLAKSDINTIFLTHAWLRSWWTAFGTGHDLCLLVIKQKEEIIGIAPLMIKKNRRLGLRAKTVQFIGAPDADYGDLIGPNKPLLWRLVLDYLMANDTHWDKVQFEQVNQDSASLPALRELLPQTGEVFDIFESDVCLRFHYRDDESKRQEFSLRRSHDLKRCYNYFKGAGGFELSRISTAKDTIERELRMLFLLHRIRWQGTTTPSRFDDERDRLFFRELVTHLPNASLCLMASYCNHIPITHSFNYEYNNTIYHYTLAFNQYYAKKSPGTLHVLVQTEAFVKQGLELDFARGAGPYKKLVADEEYRNYRITIYGRTWEKQMLDAYNRLKQTGWGQKLIQSKKAQEIKGRIINAIHEHGLLGAVAHMLANGIKRIVPIKPTAAYMITAAPTSVLSVAAHEQFHELTSLETGMIATCYGYLLDSPEAKAIEARFQNGFRCFGIFEYGVLSASVWLTPDENQKLIDCKQTLNCESPETIALLLQQTLHTIKVNKIPLEESTLAPEVKQLLPAHP